MLTTQNSIRCAAVATMCLALIAVAAGCQQTKKRSSKSSFSLLSRSGAQTSDTSADMQLALAQSHERMGEVAKAIEAYERLAEEEEMPEAMHRLGVLYDKQGKFNKATMYYSKALKHRPDDAELLCDVGYSFFIQEDWKLSESYLSRALKIDPKLERAHNNLGLLHACMNQPDAALADFRSATRDGEVALANFKYAYNEKSLTAPVAVKDATQPVKIVDIPVTELPTDDKVVHAFQDALPAMWVDYDLVK